MLPDENQLRMMLTTAAQMGAKIALAEVGLTKKEVTKAEAYRRFSRRSVDGWVSSGKITPVKRGKKIMLVLVDLELLSKTNELIVRHLQATG